MCALFRVWLLFIVFFPSILLRAVPPLTSSEEQAVSDAVEQKLGGIKNWEYLHPVTKYRMQKTGRASFCNRQFGCIVEGDDGIKCLTDFTHARPDYLTMGGEGELYTLDEKPGVLFKIEKIVAPTEVKASIGDFLKDAQQQFPQYISGKKVQKWNALSSWEGQLHTLLSPNFYNYGFCDRYTFLVADSETPVGEISEADQQRLKNFLKVSRWDEIKQTKLLTLVSKFDGNVRDLFKKGKVGLSEEREFKSFLFQKIFGLHAFHQLTGHLHEDINDSNFLYLQIGGESKNPFFWKIILDKEYYIPIGNYIAVPNDPSASAQKITYENLATTWKFSPKKIEKELQNGGETGSIRSFVDDYISNISVVNDYWNSVSVFYGKKITKENDLLRSRIAASFLSFLYTKYLWLTEENKKFSAREMVNGIVSFIFSQYFSEFQEVQSPNFVANDGYPMGGFTSVVAEGSSKKAVREGKERSSISHIFDFSFPYYRKDTWDFYRKIFPEPSELSCIKNFDCKLASKEHVVQYEARIEREVGKDSYLNLIGYMQQVRAISNWKIDLLRELRESHFVTEAEKLNKSLARFIFSPKELFSFLEPYRSGNAAEIIKKYLQKDRFSAYKKNAITHHGLEGIPGYEYDENLHVYMKYRHPENKEKKIAKTFSTVLFRRQARGLQPDQPCKIDKEKDALQQFENLHVKDLKYLFKLETEKFPTRESLDEYLGQLVSSKTGYDYGQGLLSMAISVKHFFPDWHLRVYIDSSLEFQMAEGGETQKIFEPILQTLDGPQFKDFVDIIYVDVPAAKTDKFHHLETLPTLFRYLALFDKNVDRVLIRDIDTVVSPVDRKFMEEWEKSGTDLHLYMQPRYSFDPNKIEKAEDQNKVRPFAGAWGLKTGETGYLPAKLWHNMLYFAINETKYKMCYGVDELAMAKVLVPYVASKRENNVMVNEFSYPHMDLIDPMILSLMEKKLLLRENSLKDGALWVANFQGSLVEIWDANAPYIHLINRILFQIASEKRQELFGVPIDYRTIVAAYSHFHRTVRSAKEDFSIDPYYQKFPVAYFSNLFPDPDWETAELGEEGVKKFFTDKKFEEPSKNTIGLRRDGVFAK